MNTSLNTEDLRPALIDYLSRWELRRFDSDADYFAYQRATLSPATLAELTARAERKRDRPGDTAAEQAFYDLAARRDILPVLYSQRYEYFLVVGAGVAARIGSARQVLDFGCGVGVLTLFYATRYPDIQFIGVDRSATSIAAATEQAGRLGLRNVRFACADLDQGAHLQHVDAVLCTHALVQAEQEAGLPSLSWATFARAVDPPAQTAFEQRTGLGARLNHLAGALRPGGRFIAFEKTRQLARRVPFQRALAARGLYLVEPPEPLRYQLVEEVADDGPLFHMVKGAGSPSARGEHGPMAWDEMPEGRPEGERYQVSGPAARLIRSRLPEASTEHQESWNVAGLGPVRVEVGACAPGLEFLFLTAASGFQGIRLLPRSGARPPQPVADDLDRLRGAAEAGTLARAWGLPDPSAAAEEAPLYENHDPTAQGVWSALAGRRPETGMTLREPGGRIMHFEWGHARGVSYLYWASTFDERQLVLMDLDRQKLVQAYYVDLTSAGLAGGAVLLKED